MAPLKVVPVRFSRDQLRMIDTLGKKLNLDRSNTIRLAIARLAEAEGLMPKFTRH